MSSVRMMSRSSSAQAGTDSHFPGRAQRLGNHLIITHPVGGNVLQIGYRPLLQPGQRAAVGKQDADAFVFPGKAVFGQALQDLLL